MDEKRVLVIKGKTNKSYRPDQIQITFKPEGRNRILSKAMEQLDNKLKKLKEKFEKLNLAENDVRMKEIKIDEENDKRGKIETYVVSQELVIKVDLDFEFLNKLLSVISEAEKNSSVTISYQIKNQEKIELELLADMTKDAYEKAKVVCENSGSKLGKLQKYTFDKDSIMEYMTQEERLPQYECKCSMTGSHFLKCDDIYFETTGYYIWALID